MILVLTVEVIQEIVLKVLLEWLVKQLWIQPQKLLEMFLKLTLSNFLVLVPSVSGEVFPNVALQVMVAIRLRVESSSYCTVS